MHGGFVIVSRGSQSFIPQCHQPRLATTGVKARMVDVKSQPWLAIIHPAVTTKVMDKMSAMYDFLSHEPNMLECAEKVEAMLSTAVLHQEDLWEMLMMHIQEEILVAMDAGNYPTSTGAAVGDGSRSNLNVEMRNNIMIPTVQVSRDTLRAMKAKLESSLDWCQLAQTRLQEVILSSKESILPPTPQAINYYTIGRQP